MARAINRLTTRAAAALREPGLYADGGGLYLRIDQAGARRWTFVFHMAGKRREMGVGPASEVSLAQARETGASAGEQVRQGVDPIAARRAVSAPATPTFGAVAHELIADLTPGWRSDKHAGQWAATLETHAAALMVKPVDAITTEDVLGALKPIWTTMPETASRVRGRVERVLDAATVKGLRAGPNPARWRGHLALLLPPRVRLSRGHFTALPYDEVAAFMRALTDQEGVGARALAFTVLTAARTGMTVGARWSEL